MMDFNAIIETITTMFEGFDIMAIVNAILGMLGLGA